MHAVLRLISKGGGGARTQARTMTQLGAAAVARRTASGGRFVMVDSVEGGTVNYSYRLSLGSEGSCSVSCVRRVVPPGEPVCL